MIDVDRSCVNARMTEMGDRLRKARMKAGYKSAAKAAAALGMPISTYSAHENGQNGFSAEWAQKYARRFGVTAAWLLVDETEPSRVPIGEEFPDDPSPDEPATIGSETGVRGVPRDGSAQIDVTSGLGAGGVTIVSDGVPGHGGLTFSAEHVRDYWRLPEMVRGSIGRRAAEIVVFPVQGDSMVPTLVEGDFVFVDTRHRVPSPDGVYALSDEFGGVVVKRLEIASGSGDDETRIRIISDNPRHAARERLLSEIQIIGRVVRRFCVVG